MTERKTKDHGESKTPDQVRAEERAAKFNTPVADRGPDSTVHVPDYDEPVVELLGSQKRAEDVAPPDTTNGG